MTLMTMIFALLGIWCDDGTGSTTRRPQGGNCSTDTDCAAGLSCIEFACVTSCSSSADCPQGTACADEPGSGRFCVAACSGTSSTLGACVDGTPTQCSGVPAGMYCAECSTCPAGKRCDFSSDTCVALVMEGAPCSANVDCVSGNCGPAEAPDGGAVSVCLVAAGQPCTPGNCGSCDATDGGSGCAQTCLTDQDCPTVQGDGTCSSDHAIHWPCLGYSQSGYFCRQPCEPFGACPGDLSCQEYLPGSCDDYFFDYACLP
jgi:hypothetical protein